jgi:hypothetical protein
VCANVGDTVTPDAPSAPTPDVPTRGPSTGSLLAGRYQLHRPVAVGEACIVWIADDIVLERRVAVKVLAEDEAVDGDHDAFLERARLTARVEHPAIATTFDSGRDGCLFSVAELAPGARLEDVVASRGPVSPSCAVVLARQLADALQAVERSGVSYGGVDVDDVMVSGADCLTVTGLRPRADDEGAVQPVASLAVGTALYTLLCGRPPARTASGALLSPRQLRADVPRVLDELTMRALGGLYRSAAAIGAALAALPALEEPATSTVRVAASPHRRVRRDTLLVGGVLLVAVLAVVVGILFQSESGRSFIRRVVPDVPVINPTPQPAPTAPASDDVDVAAAFSGDLEPRLASDAIPETVQLGNPVPVTTAHDYDPYGDQGENPETIPAVIDDDLATAWRSERYVSTDFGNLKDGVGLWLDVPAGTKVAAVRVRSAEGGWAASVRVANGPVATVDGWGSDRATLANAAGVTDELVLDRPATGNAVLVWFTRLPPSGVMTVAEVEVIGVASSPDGA